MRHFRLCLEDALDERVDEVLLPLANSDATSPPYSEVQEVTNSFMEKMDQYGLRNEFDSLLGLLRSYSFDQSRACYIQGFKDHQALLVGDLNFLSEKDG